MKLKPIHICVALLSIAAIIVGIILRQKLLEIKTTDYYYFLEPWFRHFANNGADGFKSIDSDYNVPYLVIIFLMTKFSSVALYTVKYVSIFFDAVLAIAVFKLSYLLLPKTGIKNIIVPFIASLLVWFSPVVILNSAAWAQCDSLYVSFIVWSLYFALQKENRLYAPLSALFAGIAFAFKLQTIFYLPVFAILWLSGRIKLRHAFAFILGFIVVTLPGIILGYPVSNILKVYITQTTEYKDRITLNTSNIFEILEFSNESINKILPKLGIIVAFVVVLFSLCAFVKLVVQKLNKKLFISPEKATIIDSKIIFLYALFITIAIPFFLPHMHDRYFYVSEIFTIIAATVYLRIDIFLASQIAALMVYRNYLGLYEYTFYAKIPLASYNSAAGAFEAAALIAVTVMLVKEYITKTKLIKITGGNKNDSEDNKN